MKLWEIRLYKLKIIKNDEVVFEGMAEELPEDLKNEDSKAIVLDNGEAVVNI
ncbi:MAG: hypothetical protein IKR04_06095 [Clostridia bacterium]|nr:hypothetical protein [Clostridia bacterium]